MTYGTPPAPCDSLPKKTVQSLVPGARTDGREIAATDKSLRRTCSWHALKGYDYRWLDLTFEVTPSDPAARTAFARRTSGEGDGDGERTAVDEQGDEASVAVGTTTEDGQRTRTAVVTVRASNALVTVTYSGSDFESKGAPPADEVRDGALRVAGDAVAVLEDARRN